MPSPFEAIEELRVATGDGAILFDARRLPQGDPELLRAERWPTLAAQGRGAVRRVEGSFGSGVLRQYRRGGLMARLARDRYVWTGESRTRPFREFRLLAHMRGLGLPVPAPLAAGYRRSGITYTAAILTAEIADARTLADLLARWVDDLPCWQALGSTLARFHHAGICHADLNAHNLLRDRDGHWWLIDFDRGEQRAPQAGWIEARLQRLLRSLRKLGIERCAGWESAWQSLRDAHDGLIASRPASVPRA